MTAAQTGNLIRKQVMLSEGNISKLDKIAKQGQVSMSEILRQAVDSFDIEEANDLNMAELKDLVSSRLKEAISSTQKANATVASTLESLSLSGLN